MRFGPATRFTACAILGLLVGCQTPQPTPAPTAVAAAVPPEPRIDQFAAKPVTQAPELPNPVELAKNAPKAYLEYSLAECEKLPGYSLLFVRQERRGLFKTLQPPERIQAWFRRFPFSVRMKWLDPGIKYGESTFIAGQNEGRVLFVPNDTPLNLPQRIYRVSPETPITWGECRYPVTDFGIELLLKQTLSTIAADPDAKIRYVGEIQTPADDRTAHCIRIDYSPEKHPAPLQKLYFDLRTHLPIRTEMLFADESIDTTYAYQQLRPDASIGDSDFVLEYERARSAQASAANKP